MPTNTIAAVVEWEVKSFDYLIESEISGLYSAVGKFRRLPINSGKRMPLAIGRGNPIGNTIVQHPKLSTAHENDKTFEVWHGTIISALPASMSREAVETILKKTLNYTLSPPFNEAIVNPPSESVIITNRWNSRNGRWFEPPSIRWPDIIDCGREGETFLFWTKDKKTTSGKLSKP